MIESVPTNPVEAEAADLAGPGARILEQIISILFPQRCVHCGDYGEALCPGCLSRLKPIGPGHCRCCGKPSLHAVPDCTECRGRRLLFHRAGAAFHYEGPARSMVHELKYGNQRRLAEKMAELSSEQVKLTLAGEVVTLTYVPMHAGKKFSRGYNQAEIYARALACRLGLPLEDMLVKRFPTTPQNRLNFDDRGNNLSNSFSLRRGCGCETEKVLLVDDVFTTGATVSECARILTDNLEVDVEAWAFARTVKTGVSTPDSDISPKRQSRRKDDDEVSG